LTENGLKNRKNLKHNLKNSARISLMNKLEYKVNRILKN